jgi:hypothetical protein
VSLPGPPAPATLRPSSSSRDALPFAKLSPSISSSKMCESEHDERFVKEIWGEEKNKIVTGAAWRGPRPTTGRGSTTGELTHRPCAAASARQLARLRGVVF